MQGEKWKPIDGYDDAYLVSTFGRVKSSERKVKHGKSGFITMPERILSQGIASNGYYTVSLAKDGVHKTHCVHVLVASAFVDGHTKDKCVVNHKDENKTNNRFDNLEWCTREYNLSYGDALLNRKQSLLKNGTWNKPPRPVVLMREGCIVASFESLNEASRQTGVHLSSIWRQCSGRTSHHSGDGWYYAEES